MCVYIHIYNREEHWRSVSWSGEVELMCVVHLVSRKIFKKGKVVLRYIASPPCAP